jgi:phenylalanyl-tRNA synthetase beta chain
MRLSTIGRRKWFLKGFEIGRIFWQEEDGLQEADAIAGILGGDPTEGKWTREVELPLTWFEAKGVLESVFGRLNLAVEYQPDCRDPRLHPGRTASLWLQGNRLGTFGQLHPQLRLARNLPDAVYVFQLDLDVLLTTWIKMKIGLLDSTRILLTQLLTGILLSSPPLM